MHVHGFPRENPCMNTFFLKPGTWREIFIEKTVYREHGPLALSYSWGGPLDNVFVFLSHSLNLFLSPCVFVSLFFSVGLSFSFLSPHFSLSLSLSLSVSPPARPPISLFVSFLVCLSLSLCLSLCFWLSLSLSLSFVVSRDKR